MGSSVRVLAAIAALGGLAFLTGCGTESARAGRGAGAPATVKTSATVSITAPADGATSVPTASEIALSTARATSTTVTVSDSTGAPVEGSLRADGSAWVPAKQLQYATSYTATVTATGAGPGGPDTKKVTFTTMSKPAKLVRVNTPLSDNQVYGVGMPIVVSFASAISKEARAEVERRLFVTSEPPQVGTWHWFSGDEVHYRTREYWQPGTKLSVRLAVGGLPLGGNAYGAQDLTINASIGDKTVMSIDNATKMLTVTRDDEVLKTIPVSLGKPSTPTSSGNMVVMTKNQSELFVSTTPGDEYRMTVYWTQRLTWGGEYLHAASWSVGDQGRRNVSHGCTNMSDENAKWLYGITRVGDPVVFKGTEQKLEWGNGWTDWDRPWDEYVKGSALPRPADQSTQG